MSYDDVTGKMPGTVDLSDKQRLIANETATWEAYVNRKLSVSYTVPISETDSPEFFAIVKGIVIDLVVAAVCFVSREAAADGEEGTWFPKDLRDEAMRRLEELCAGAAPPEAADEPDTAIPTDGLTATTAETPFFTRAMDL